jgi:lipid-A-disaccharide synthase
MEPLSEQKCVMIIAGEASGDLHGSRLVTAMRERNKALFFCGIGGQAEFSLMLQSFRLWG